jgi:uncharacterized protein (DUF58 family)
MSATTHSKSYSQSTWIDPATLMRIKGLQMRAKVVVEGFFNGLHRSPFHGFSVEFSEYRQYTSGDDPRYLDWRLFARTDRYYIKRFEDETNLRCYLLTDLSRSMGFGSLAYNKVDYARTMAATFAYYLSNQRDAVGLLTFHREISDYIPARFRPGHLHRILVALETALAGDATDLARPMEHLAELVSKRGLIVLISDLLTPIDQLKDSLAYLRSRGHEVVILRVLDPAERDFTFTDASMFMDLESGRRLYVDPQEVRANYLRRFAEHSQALEELCGGLGIDLCEFTTDHPLELALFDFVQARARRGRLVNRRYAHSPSATG